MLGQLHSPVRPYLKTWHLGYLGKVRTCPYSPEVKRQMREEDSSPLSFWVWGTIGWSLLPSLSSWVWTPSCMYFEVRPDLSSSMTDPSRASVRVLRVIMCSSRGEGSALCSHVVKRDVRQYFDHRGVGAPSLSNPNVMTPKQSWNLTFGFLGETVCFLFCQFTISPSTGKIRLISFWEINEGENNKWKENFPVPTSNQKSKYQLKK